MIVESLTSGRTYAIRIKNSGIVTLTRTANDESNITSLMNRTLLNQTRTAAFSFDVKDTDLSNPVIVLRQRGIGMGRAYVTLLSPNEREWEVFVAQDGVYKVRALATEWPTAHVPILTDPSGVPWRFEVADGGIYQVTSGTTVTERRDAFLLTQDGKRAYQITAGIDGLLSVSDPLPPSAAQHYDILLVSPSGFHYLLRVDNDGVLYIDEEWQLAQDQADEWPLLLLERRGTLYCVDARYPPNISGTGRGIRMN